jgi:hypothetical protein
LIVPADSYYQPVTLCSSSNIATQQVATMTDTYNATHNNTNLTAGDGPLEKDFSNGSSGHKGMSTLHQFSFTNKLTVHEENTISTETWIPLMR